MRRWTFALASAGLLSGLGCEPKDVPRPVSPVPTVGPGVTATSSMREAVQPASPAGAFAPDRRPAAGAFHSCAIKADGSLLCWGGNHSGQLGDGTDRDSSRPVPVSGMGAGVVAVSAGYFHTCAIESDGGLWCWGANSDGRLGDGTTEDRRVPTAVVGMEAGVASVSAGRSHTCAVKTDGSAWCWGANHHGFLGDGTTDASAKPVAVRGLAAGVALVDAGARRTCAVETDGSLSCWGDGVDPATGADSDQYATSPVAVRGLGSAVTGVVVGGGYDGSQTCALASGSVWCWGELTDAKGNARQRSQDPVKVTALGSDVIAIAAGGDLRGSVTCALARRGSLSCWGSNRMGQLGDGTRTFRLAPRPVSDLASDVASLDVGSDHACAQKTDGRLFCWGANARGALGDGHDGRDRLAPEPVSGLGSGVVSLAVREELTCAVKDDASAWCWGNRSRDTSSNADLLELARVNGLDARVMALGRLDFGCAVHTDGSVWCWGDNSHGQLGDGTQEDHAEPRRVNGAGAGAVSVGAGAAHTCALAADGRVWCWGANSDGRLGDGTTFDRTTPVAVLGMDDAVALAVGALHSCVIRTDRSVWCWGENDMGQLGNGTMSGRAKPTPVRGLKDATFLAAGDDLTCAVKKDGSLWCWGESLIARTPEAVLRTNPEPVQVTVSGVTSVALNLKGSRHACVVRSDGSAWCWGTNRVGQLGDGTTNDSTEWVAVKGLSDVVSVWVGDERSYAVRRDGSLWGWGSNCEGCLLADGEAWKAVPVEVR